MDQTLIEILLGSNAAVLVPVGLYLYKRHKAGNKRIAALEKDNAELTTDNKLLAQRLEILKDSKN